MSASKCIVAPSRWALTTSLRNCSKESTFRWMWTLKSRRSRKKSKCSPNRSKLKCKIYLVRSRCRYIGSYWLIRVPEWIWQGMSGVSWHFIKFIRRVYFLNKLHGVIINGAAYHSQLEEVGNCEVVGQWLLHVRGLESAACVRPAEGREEIAWNQAGDLPCDSKLRRVPSSVAERRSVSQ